MNEIQSVVEEYSYFEKWQNTTWYAFKAMSAPSFFKMEQILEKLLHLAEIT